MAKAEESIQADILTRKGTGKGQRAKLKENGKEKRNTKTCNGKGL